MRIEEEKIQIDGKELILRNAKESEAGLLIDYLKAVTAETRFLMCESDEVHYTIEEEKDFIRKHNESEDSLLIAAFLEGQYIGNCSFDRVNLSRRNYHRAGIGIALFQKYTGFGYGKIMLEKLIREIEKAGYEQIELTVVSGNEKAYRLYKKLGFVECGRVPNANKYDDNTYADDIKMIKRLV